MNSNMLPIAALAVATAAIILPVSAVAITVTATVAGTIAILLADYGREIRPLRSEARTLPFVASGRPTADMREAA
jgi:hypothetical protein